MTDAAASLKQVTKQLSAIRYYRPNLIIFFTFLLFVLARYMQWGARREFFAQIRIEFTLGIFLTVACVMLLFRHPVDFRPARRILILVGLLFALTLVQIPFAAAGAVARTIFYDRVLKFAMLTLFVMVLVQSPLSLRAFIAAFLLSLLYITQESTRGALSGSMIWENQGIPRLHGSVPAYGHPNSLGGVSMGAIPYVVYLLPVVRSWFLRIPLLVLGVTATTCVLYTGSRTAYVSFFSFSLAWFLLSRRKRQWLLRAMLIAVIAFPVIPQHYKERFASIGGQEAEGRSKETRIQILSDAWQVFLENPLGVGVASFPVVRQQRFGRMQDTHNLYLEVATNLGGQGVVVFLALVASMLGAYRKSGRRFEDQRRRISDLLHRFEVPDVARRHLSNHDRDLAFLAAVAKATWGFLFIRLVVGFFGMDLYEIYWWFCAGLAISLLTLADTTLRKTEALALATEDQCQAEYAKLPGTGRVPQGC